MLVLTSVDIPDYGYNEVETMENLKVHTNSCIPMQYPPPPNPKNLNVTV